MYHDVIYNDMKSILPAECRHFCWKKSCEPTTPICV